MIGYGPSFLSQVNSGGKEGEEWRKGGLRIEREREGKKIKKQNEEEKSGGERERREERRGINERRRKGRSGERRKGGRVNGRGEIERREIEKEEE